MNVWVYASASCRDSRLLAALRASPLTRTSASLIHLVRCNFFASASRRDSQLLAALRASLLTRTSASLIHLVRCNFFASASRRDSRLLAPLRASLLTRPAHAKTIRPHRPRTADHDTPRR